MFESVERLEKEVKEFENNILASKEFVSKLEGIIVAISEQERDFAVRTKELTANIANNANALSATQADALKTLIGENHSIVKRLEDTSLQFESSMKSQIDAIGVDHQELVKQLVNAKKAISSDCDRMVATLNEANQEHLAKTTEIVSSTQKEYICAIERAEASIITCKDELSKRYDEFLQKLESTNVKQMFRLCQEMKQSINTKLFIVMSGVGVSVILMVIALLIK